MYSINTARVEALLPEQAAYQTRRTGIYGICRPDLDQGSIDIRARTVLKSGAILGLLITGAGLLGVGVTQARGHNDTDYEVSASGSAPTIDARIDCGKKVVVPMPVGDNRTLPIEDGVHYLTTYINVGSSGYALIHDTSGGQPQGVTSISEKRYFLPLAVDSRMGAQEVIGFPDMAGVSILVQAVSTGQVGAAGYEVVCDVRP